MRTTLQIRKADEQIFDKVRKFNFSKFVSEMMHSHGQDWINEQLSQLQTYEDEMNNYRPLEGGSKS